MVLAVLLVSWVVRPDVVTLRVSLPMVAQEVLQAAVAAEVPPVGEAARWRPGWRSACQASL